ncbi:MAG: XdhC family protein, partial [Bacteroidota bacterium]
IFSQIEEWTTTDTTFAIATVIKTWRSAPRMEGASMAISDQTDILGSVSGGCVEGAVIRAAQEVMQQRVSQRLAFGISNEDAWSVGLSCGGRIEVLVEPFLGKRDDQGAKVWTALQEAIHQNRGCVLLSPLDASQGHHYLVYPDGQNIGQPSPNLLAKAQTVYTEHKNQIIETEAAPYFANIFPAKDRLLIIGAAHLSADLVDLAHQFNFETTVIDPRGIFTNKMEFTTAPHFIHEKWPEEVLSQFALDADTYAVVLSHDPKIDDQALHSLLRSKVAYIGALGSKKTHAKRVKRLTEAGFSATEIARIHGPVGVAINARRPKEIALSIIAEMVKIKNRFL